MLIRKRKVVMFRTFFLFVICQSLQVQFILKASKRPSTRSISQRYRSLSRVKALHFWQCALRVRAKSWKMKSGEKGICSAILPLPRKMWRNFWRQNVSSGLAAREFDQHFLRVTRHRALILHYRHSSLLKTLKYKKEFTVLPNWKWLLQHEHLYNHFISKE